MTRKDTTIRLTAAQAVVRYLSALQTSAWATSTGATSTSAASNLPQSPQSPQRLFAGVFAIFGHGNVAGMGEALYQYRRELPTYRAHNEQAMAHSAIAFAKANMRRRMMAVTTSIGPGATNLVTAAALAHVNRLPVLLLPGDVFSSRAPDPVLQQVEDFQDGGASANDCLRPVSRYFDRIHRPEQLLTALPRAIHVLTDPALCGPVTLALPQDVQTMAFDFPSEFFSPQPVLFRAPAPTDAEVAIAAKLLRSAQRPLLIAGGGTLYAQASQSLRAFAEAHGVPVCETQAGKSSLPWDHPLQMGSIGVTGSPAANELAREADLVLALGTRLQDFTTGSRSLFGATPMLAINVNALDALKGNATRVIADAGAGLQAISAALTGWQSSASWQSKARDLSRRWRDRVSEITGRREVPLPYEGEVIGAVQRSAADSSQRDIVVCASGTLPAELHKLWRASTPGGYHMEYGYSTMGYEIAGGLGVKMAQPEREVIVMLGDGSYLMLNSEIATSLMLGHKLIVVVLDNGGYGCINRLQQACGGAPFNNLLADCEHGEADPPVVDFAAHAAALGARAENVGSIAQLEDALQRARKADRTTVLCIRTDPARTTDDGGCWWEVAVPEVSVRAQVQSARHDYEIAATARDRHESKV